MCSRLRLKIAYVELNATNQIRSLSKSNDSIPFLLYHMDVYPDCTKRNLTEIMQKGYDCIIFDMGVLGLDCYKELAACNQKFIVGSIRPWKIKHTWDVFLKFKIQNFDAESISLLGNLGIKEDADYCKTHYHMKILTIPFLNNPFQLTVSDWKFFEEIL